MKHKNSLDTRGKPRSFFSFPSQAVVTPTLRPGKFGVE
ncbi:hypothetical protein ETAA8_69560 [Anatilimnocola aggregata]|uniref:Uncharacterized protein n=1 Tax=Anatilimnocola aggregata TaxID=2528021 RepID=A0A517YNL4_9BACT|nr:hypothetical protein ETAA8_69560 [Anatilimnocola aggregata]